MKDSKKGAGLLIILLILCFTLYGLYFSGFGANSSNMIEFFGITESKQGFIMTIQSVGALVIAIILGIFGERINKLHGMFAGTLVMGIAGILIGTLTSYTKQGTGYGLMLTYSIVGGLGYMTIDLLMNAVVADVFPERKEAVLPRIHAFYGAGSMLAPLLVSALASPENPASFSIPYLVIGIGATVVAALFLYGDIKVTPQTKYADITAIRAKAAANPFEVFKSSRAWLYFLSCFLYLSFQTGLVAWLPRFFENRFGTSYETANSMLTLYFLGALVIRLLSPMIYKRVSVKKYFYLSIGASAILFVLFLLIPGIPKIMQWIMLVVLGLLQGIAVPSLQILIMDDFSDRTASASAVIIFGVAISALVTPVVMGAIIEKTGYASSMWFITVLLALSIAALAAVKNKLTNK